LRKTFPGEGTDLRPATSSADGEAVKVKKQRECSALEEDAAEALRTTRSGEGAA
jgi:hypothetical protein